MDGTAMCPVKDKDMELGRRESERPYVHDISVYMAAPTHENTQNKNNNKKGEKYRRRRETEKNCNKIK